MSEFETYPQVAIEAAAARRPMIVADDGAGLREMAEDGLARMVSLDSSPAGLAGAISGESTGRCRVSAPASPPGMNAADAIARAVQRRPAEHVGIIPTGSFGWPAGQA